MLRLLVDPQGGGEGDRAGSPDAAVNLSVALALRRVLGSFPVEVALTRTRDELVPVRERVLLAAAATATVSLSHAPLRHGTPEEQEEARVFVDSRKTPAEVEAGRYHSASEALGYALATALNTYLGRPVSVVHNTRHTLFGRGWRNRRPHLRHDRPVVVVIPASVTSPRVQAALKSRTWAPEVAGALARGLVAHYRL